MSNAIINILYDKPFDRPKKSLAEVLYQIINEEGIDVAIQKYPALKNDTNSYNLNEREFNNLGYLFLRRNQIKEAIEIFKLNVAAFSESSNTYDSLGEAYMKNGEKQLAIKNYKKSLELDSNNTNAVNMLKKLEE